MKSFFKKELFLWQAILIFIGITSLLLLAGFYYTNQTKLANSNPVSKVDQEMLKLEKQVTKNTNNPEVYVKLGSIFYSKGALKEAKTSYAKALTLDKNNLAALYHLSIIFKEEKDYETSLKYVKRLLKIHAKHAPAKFILAQVYIDMEKYSDSEKVLLDIAETYSTDADYYYYLGFVSEKLDKENIALQSYEKALSFDPDFWKAKLGVKRLNQ